MTVVVEEGETKGTTEAGCQTETGVMRVALKASQMNFPGTKMKLMRLITRTRSMTPYPLQMLKWALCRNF
jgi:hypothetical protein